MIPDIGLKNMASSDPRDTHKPIRKAELVIVRVYLGMSGIAICKAVKNNIVAMFILQIANDQKTELINSNKL